MAFREDVIENAINSANSSSPILLNQDDLRQLIERELDGAQVTAAETVISVFNDTDTNGDNRISLEEYLAAQDH